MWTTTPVDAARERRRRGASRSSSTASTSVGGPRAHPGDGARGIAQRWSKGAPARRPRRATLHRAPSSSGCGYRRPLDVVPLPDDRAARASSSPGDFVTADDGSGMVHMAPAFGADDYAAGQEHGLAFVRPGRGRRDVPRAPRGRRSRAGSSPRRRPTTSSSSGSRQRGPLAPRRVVRATRYPHCWRCSSR